MRCKAGNNPSRGLTIVEFVGCLAALGGGVVLGSIYLGVDVKAMAVELLEKADIDLPESLGNIQGTEESAATPTENSSEQPLDAEVSDATATTEEEEEASVDDVTDDQGSSAPVEVKQLTDEEKRVATNTCWRELSAAMKAESANRTNPIRDPSNWQLFDYLLHRKEGHAKVVDAIEAIDLNGVDQRLKAHVQQVLAWHRLGVELFERATQLLTDAPAGKLSGPFAQSWQSASTQHRMEEKLVLGKHQAMARYLDHLQKTPVASPSSP